MSCAISTTVGGEDTKMRLGVMELQKEFSGIVYIGPYDRLMDCLSSLR